MAVLPQIFLGSTLLVLCTLLQIWVVVWTVRQLQRRKAYRDHAPGEKVFLISAVVFAPLLATHTAHIYFWALSLWALGALPGYEEPIYFSLVTYTTVGYGDITLPRDFRIFGAMASVNGILAFGLTTAFLVSLFTRLLSDGSET